MKTIAYVFPDLSIIGAQKNAAAFSLKLIEKGYHIDYLLMHKVGKYVDEVDQMHIKVFSVNYLKQIKIIGLLVSMFVLARMLRKNHYDIVISVAPFLNRILCLFKKLKIFRSHLVIEEHIYPPTSRKDEFSYPAQLFYKHSEFLYQYANKIKVLTQGTYDYYDRKSFKGKLVLLNSFYNIQDMINEGNLNPSLVLSEKCHNIVYVGRLTTQKNIPFLLQVMKQLVSKHSVYLYIIGRGPEEESMKTFCHSLQLDSHVSFLGRVEHVLPILKQSVLFPLTSVWEALPSVIIEAMILHVPVVSVDCKTGPRELIGDDSSRGWLVPENDISAFCEAVEVVLIDKEKVRSKTEKAFQLMTSHYDIQNGVNVYIDQLLLA